MGQPAPFPQGPFILASILRCPVQLIFALRQQGKLLSLIHILSLIWFNLLLIVIRNKPRRRRLARRSIAASFRLFLAVVKMCIRDRYHSAASNWYSWVGKTRHEY